MLLGYVVLGTVWTEDPKLKIIYDEYETWLNTKENVGQIIKWCTTLRTSNFENTKENKTRYVEIFKFIFREVLFYPNNSLTYKVIIAFGFLTITNVTMFLISY